MAELMMVIGIGVLAWFAYKFFEDAKERAWEEGFEDGKRAGYDQGKVIGTVEAVCDLIEVDFSR